jgi:hypothetical protein
MKDYIPSLEHLHQTDTKNKKEINKIFLASDFNFIHTGCISYHINHPIPSDIKKVKGPARVRVTQSVDVDVGPIIMHRTIIHPLWQHQRRMRLLSCSSLLLEFSK